MPRQTQDGQARKGRPANALQMGPASWEGGDLPQNSKPAESPKALSSSKREAPGGSQKKRHLAHSEGTGLPAAAL